MKKVTLFLLLVALCLSSAWLTGDCLYPRYGKIVALEYDVDLVYIRDAAGLVWFIEGCEDWTCGDDVAMLMFNRFTPNTILDDVIVKIH